MSPGLSPLSPNLSPETNMTTRKETLVTFDAVTAARSSDVQKELLKMAKADNNPEALEHALNVISLARKTSPEHQ